jgi:DMSO/TMAO reductase YedYZ molybdopterin-dependent catalytic subunit
MDLSIDDGIARKSADGCAAEPHVDDPIISTDTLRLDRLPPRQVQTRDWPELTAGQVPPFDASSWDFTIFPVPLVDRIKSFCWSEFSALPRVKVFADLHCVTRLSLLDNLWGGVSTRELAEHVRISPAAKFVMVHCEYGFTTNLPIEDFFGEDCLFAFDRNGETLLPERGYPVRLIVPRLYAWKSAKWVRGIEFMEEDRPGFWESWEHGGHHMRGDPWQVDETGDGQRFRKR